MSLGNTEKETGPLLYRATRREVLTYAGILAVAVVGAVFVRDVKDHPVTADQPLRPELNPAQGVKRESPAVRNIGDLLNHDPQMNAWKAETESGGKRVTYEQFGPASREGVVISENGLKARKLPDVSAEPHNGIIWPRFGKKLRWNTEVVVTGANGEEVNRWAVFYQKVDELPDGKAVLGLSFVAIENQGEVLIDVFPKPFDPRASA